MELVKWLKLQWDRAVAIAAAVVGAVMLFYGWLKISDSPVVTDQMSYVVSAGLGGLFLLGIAATLWLSADFRDEWRALERLADAESGAETPGDEALRERLDDIEARLAVLSVSTPARGRTRLQAKANGTNGSRSRQDA